jgi:hypothetical protein
MLNRDSKKKCVRAAMVAAVLLCGAATAHADVVLDWNRTMLATMTGSPFASARYAAITQLAVFEAVNAITREYKPYLGTITAPAGASAEAAAAAAAHAVLVNYFPLKAAALDAALATSLSAIPDGTAKDDGVAVGQAAAAAMIALRANDGSAVPPFTYTPTSTDAGQWQATPSCGAAAVGVNYHWQFVTPFALPNAPDFRAETPPLLTSGAYAKAYNEVKTVGAIDSAARPQDRTDVARFYAGGLSPVGWANIAAQQIAGAQPHSLAENARALALVNMAISDAAVAVFDSKYHFTAWRPETAIHGAAEDGNPKTDPDLAFTPFVVAPCFPGYPSAHGTLSAAAAEVLQHLYGASGHDLTFSAASVPGIVLHYTAFKDIVADISDARVYGGIHFRFDQDGGERQGERIGQYVFKNILRPVDPE